MPRPHAPVVIQDAINTAAQTMRINALTIMTKRLRLTNDGMAKVALALIDLRAHFEAQLRTVVRAEQTLLQCRGAHDAATFDAAADTLRTELHAMADNRRSARQIVEQVVADARKL